MLIQAIPLDDATGSTAAENTITISGVPAVNGTLHLHIAGVYLAVGVLSTDTATDIADSIVAKIDELKVLPVTATNSAGVVTLVAKNKGTVGNDMAIKLNWYGSENNHFTPEGVVVVIENTVVGATDPLVEDAVAVMPDSIINHIICPYNDVVNLLALTDELDRRWLPTVQLEGHAFTSLKGTTSELVTEGTKQNNEHLTYLDAGQDNPTPAYLMLAGTVGRCAPSLEADPARPLQTLDIKGVITDKKLNHRNFLEATMLLNSGIATMKVAKDGTLLVERLITTYQTSNTGAPDVSYLDANTPYTTSYLRQTLLNRIRIKFPRHKLANNGTRIPAGQATVTPSIIAGEIIALASAWGELGLVEDLQAFADELLVERNLIDRNRIDAVLPTNLVNQFRIFAASIKFIL